MINRTKLDKFNLIDNDISYQGYQLSAIDYDRTIFIKTPIDDKDNINYKEHRMFKEIFHSTSIIFFGIWFDCLPLLI